MSSDAALRRAADGARVSALYFHPLARELAATWGARFRLIEAGAPPQDEAGFFLWAAGDRLELRLGGQRAGLWIDPAELRRRSTQRSELLRACGVTGRRRPSVIDVMAGWGVDGLTLAARGCEVMLVERHAAVSALQEDLLRRSGLGGVRCRWDDGIAVLTAFEAADVVYLDPMFPARGKGALPGKRMQWLARLGVADPRPLTSWLDAARAKARARVVLKRRRSDPPLAEPDWQIRGRAVRYDVYRGEAGGGAVESAESEAAASARSS